MERLGDGFYSVKNGIAHPINSYWCRQEYSQFGEEELGSAIHHLQLAQYLCQVKNALKKDNSKRNVVKFTLIRFGQTNDVIRPYLRSLTLDHFFEACNLGRRLVADSRREEVDDIVRRLFGSKKRANRGALTDLVKTCLPEGQDLSLGVQNCKYC